MKSSSGPDTTAGFTKKVWITCGILAFIVVILLLFKTLFGLLLLVFAAVLITIYFYGISCVFQKTFHWPAKLSIVLSVILNVLLLVAFIWLTQTRIQQQITGLTDTLPATIQKLKDQINQSQVGHKLLQQVNSSGDSKKTLEIVRSFFSSSFGIISDLYIITLLALFFTASPSLYKNGIIKILHPKQMKRI